MPKLNFFYAGIFGQMTVGALSGLNMSDPCRRMPRRARTIGQSVIVSAPLISLMFILGTSTVLVQHLASNNARPSTLIGPIPQTMRIAFGAVSWVAPCAIALVIARAIASASLIFTASEAAMAAGWDGVVPDGLRSCIPCGRRR